ncbi:MAG: HAD family hydrolase [Vicinamibacterales bacterium]
MPDRRIDVIAFDADDTLWHNERSYRDARARFRVLLAEAGVALSDDELEQFVNQREVQNIGYYGYGVSSFILSLIETAVELSDGRIDGRAIAEVIAISKQMLTEDVELFEGAREALAALAPHYPLMLVTKGDLLHQQSKLERSGLQGFFRYVEVVSHKTCNVYRGILARHAVDPDRFLMVGNSLRSDVVPVIELGGRAVHVPAALSWAHEHAELPADDRGRCFEIATLLALPGLVATIEMGA